MRPLRGTPSTSTLDGCWDQPQASSARGRGSSGHRLASEDPRRGPTPCGIGLVTTKRWVQHWRPYWPPTSTGPGPQLEHVFVRTHRRSLEEVLVSTPLEQVDWNAELVHPVDLARPFSNSSSSDVANIYVRGADNALWQRAWYDNQWHDWARHNDGGVLASEPALGSMGPNHEHVFVRGTDANVWQKFWTYVVEPAGEVSFPVSECVYGWTARYLQSGTHVTVRIQLNPDAGITDATMNALRTTWRNGIIATWSNRFECRASNGARQPVTFDVQWVGSNAHHVVRVQPGPARSNMGLWDTNDTGDVSAHEFGHMLGHPDEYADAACPARSPVNTGTVMADNTEAVARHYNRITAFHGAGHTPSAIAPEPAELISEVAMTSQLIDNLKPEPRAAVLRRLRQMGEVGDAPVGAEDTEVVFEVSGGAPGERYVYRLGVRGDGAAQRRMVDETQPGEDEETHTRHRQAAREPGVRGGRRGWAARRNGPGYPRAARWRGAARQHDRDRHGPRRRHRSPDCRAGRRPCLCHGHPSWRAQRRADGHACAAAGGVGGSPTPTPRGPAGSRGGAVTRAEPTL